MEDDFYFNDDFHFHYGGYKRKTPDEDNAHITKKSIYEYLELWQKHRRCYKLVGLITNNQSAMMIARGDLDDHWAMTVKLNQLVFPKRNYDFNYLYNHGIEVYSLGYDLNVNLPSKVSPLQYKALLDIINQVLKFEEDYGKIPEYFDADELLKEAKEKLSDSYIFERDENIVGTALDEELFSMVDIEDDALNSRKNTR